MASNTSNQFKAIGRGDTEQEARQNAIANASAALHFEIPNIVDGTWNEGAGVYTLIYTAPGNESSPPGNESYSSGAGASTYGLNNTNYRVAIGEGDTEEDAKQDAFAKAYTDAEFEPIIKHKETWNEGRGIYILEYSLLNDKQDNQSEDKKDEDKINKQKEEAKGSVSGDGAGGATGAPAKKLVGQYDNLTKELRNTPGYTNYVVSTAKNINGTIASSSVFKRYYSDISAEAYINGEWFEDINTIAWQVNQQQYPIYGYNSYIYDDLALGTRIIQGQFTINFTEPNIIAKAIAQGTKSSTVNNASTYEDYSTQAHKNKVAIDGSPVTYQGNAVRSAIWKPRFDIDIVFGEKEKLDNVEIMPKHIILWDCSVSNSGIGVSANGGVLVETYTFIARDFKIIS